MIRGAKMSSIFKATARRSGNSIVVTVPKEVAQGLEIKNGTVLRVTVLKVDEEKETK